MNKIKISSFKAFDKELVIPLDGRKNLLLYGENGAGKSSIFEAIKVSFFKDKLKTEIKNQSQTPEDANQKTNELWESYNNKISNKKFELAINDTDYLDFDTTNHQVFLISIQDLYSSNELTLIEVLKRFKIDFDGKDFEKNNYEVIEKNVNDTLNLFNENIKIEFDNQKNYEVKLIDTKKNIESKIHFKTFFNEAKLNLVILLITLNCIQQAKNVAKNKLLVLDDFITSLDASNRTFIVNYLLNNFKDFQLIILTHNISFYNLIRFIINDITKSLNEWVLANLFEINNTHKIFIKSERESAALIQKDFTALIQPASTESIDAIGNRVRKKFETILYEFSKLLMLGAVEESSNIISKIESSKNIYFNNKKTVYDLIDEIEELIQGPNQNNLVQRVQEKINQYKQNDFDNLKQIIKSLKLYQKVTLHPMSHGINGLQSFTTKEIKISLELLEKFETWLKNFVDDNVSTV